MENPSVKQPNKKYLTSFTSRKWRQRGFLILLVAIPLLNFLVFWVYVNLQTLAMTFQRFDVTTGQNEFIAFERYWEVIEDYVLGKVQMDQNVFLNSLRAIVINLIILPLAFICSYAFHKKIRFQKFFRLAFMFPSMISLVVLTMLFRYMFAGDFGPIAEILSKICGHKIDFLGVESDHLWTLIYIFCIWAGMGTNVIMISGAMNRIPKELSEAGMIDGLGFWQEAVYVVLPLVMPTIGIYFISILTSCLSFTLQPMLIARDIGPDNKFLTMSWYVFMVTNGGGPDQMLQAATVGIVFSLLLLPFIALARFIAKKLTADVSF